MSDMLRSLAMRRYALASALTFLVAAIQLVAYYFLGARSVTLYADTFHAGSDGIALLLTCYLLARTTFFLVGTERIHRAFTYANIGLLFLGVALSAHEILEQYRSPTSPTVMVVVIVAIGGLGDIAIRRVLRSVPRGALPATLRTNHDANLLHISQDVWMSYSVVASAIAIALGYPYIDTLAGSIVTLAVLWEATGLLYEEATGKRFKYRFHRHGGEDCDHSHHHH